MTTAEQAYAVNRSGPPKSAAAIMCSPETEQYRRGEPASRDPLAPGANPVLDRPLVTDLVARARKGDMQAWDALVGRYDPLLWSICRRHRLADADADADDVVQSVWLSLVDQLHMVRDPAALPGWLATTTRRECLRVLRAARGLLGQQVLAVEILRDEQSGTAEQDLLAAERHAALREAFLALPPSGQQLIAC